MTNNFENENNEDFIEPELGSAEEAGHHGGIAGNLAEAWRTRPLFKFMVLVVAVFAVGVAAMSFFGGNNATSEIARMNKPPALTSVPGGESSPYHNEQTKLANETRAEQALATGGSAMPTMTGKETNVGGFANEENKADPLKELKVETENLRKQVAQQQVQQQQIQQQQVQQQRPQEQFDSSLAEAMQRQMSQLLQSWTPAGIKNVTVVKPSDLKEEQDAREKATQTAASAAAATPAAEAVAQKNLINAGTVSYAQLLTEANSDVPGPILAQIVSGPLTGARAVGSFQVATGYEKYLVLKFTLADKKGKDYQINAIALDPDTTLGGMATEVDERYFARVVLPAAAGFLQGMGSAMGQGNSTITTNGSTTITTQANSGFKQGMYNGLGQGAQTMGQFFQDQANLTKPLVRVAAGTPMGMFFVAPVAENGASTTPNQQQNANTGAGYNANYPGTTVNGYGSNLQNNANVPYPNYSTPGYGYSRNSTNNSSGYGSTGTSQYSNYGQ